MDRLCTIIAQNYLPQAMALLESTRKMYPAIDFYILITDAEAQNNFEPLLPTAHILTPEDLNIEFEWLTEMRSYYDAVEMATSLKPFLLETLLIEGVESVTFLDPDILLYSELSDGFDAARANGIALTPHRLTPSNILKDGYNELAFMQYGIFNLGYIAVGQAGREMLKWWAERLRWYSTRFPNDVVFTDQKWINFVPALFDFRVIKHFGYDIAPWNIDERPLTTRNGQYFAGGQPVVFVHFSQMSGKLAVGLETDLWQNALTGSSENLESLRIISFLTHEYSQTLATSQKLIASTTTGNTQQKQSVLPGFYQRRNLIEQSFKRQRGEKIVSWKTPKFFQRFVKILEKSGTFNGAREGLRRDLQKIVQRLRNFFQK